MMDCPKCKGPTVVRDTVYNREDEEYYRKHVCKDCGTVFYTREEIVYEDENGCLPKWFKDVWTKSHRRNRKKKTEDEE